MGSGHVFVVLGADVRVLTSTDSCHVNTIFCINIKDACFHKTEMFFDVDIKMVFVLTSTGQFQHLDTREI